MVRAFLFSIFVATITTSATAQEAPAVPEAPVATSEGPMTVERMAQIILDIDPEAELAPNGFELSIDDVPVLVIVAPEADRMRALVPIASVEDVTPEEMLRMMQANFDTALDGRYAVAQGRVWGVYIHPFASLEREQFLSGLVQTVTLAQTYGSLYSGGANVFGRGDSAEIYRDLFEDLLNRGQDI